MDPLTLGAAALAVFILFGKKKKKPVVQPGTGDLPTPDPTPDPPPKPGGDTPKPPTGPATVPSDVIGGGWQWDEKAIWPSEGSVAGALIAISQGRYAPGGNFAMPNYTITGQSGQSAVRQFQRDWNRVQAKNRWELLVPAGTARPVGYLEADGFIGKNTWKAMRWVFRHDTKIKNVPSANPYLTWEKVVQGANALP